MARYTGAVCRLCRREGQKLYLKGDRCYTDKCSVGRRSYAPGQHGQGRKKVSEYGLQLRAKQATRRYYGVLEGQFRHYYDLAKKREGKVGEQLLVVLETRLDNIVYRLGFASSRPEARQLVIHNHFSVNGKGILERNASRPVPKWLEVNSEQFAGKMINYPVREDIDLPVEETLIVELYSKL